MSAPKAKNPRLRKAKTLAEYRAEVRDDPFVLPVDEERELVVPRPIGDQLIAAEEAAHRGATAREGLRAMCGDMADEVLDVLGKEDHEVMANVLEDMRDFFGLGEERA